uniref:Acetolactate synthase small subunit n=1 Tax=Leptospirillum sp. Group II '5-way CG' TaxID=419541 RepID=B6ASG6_9BACT|nr:MAG: acetolactate synthase small subunit [Leptospirillum sp. Group II '5-way CG']
MSPDSSQRKHHIQILVENRFGVLARVAGLFSARGYNIESLSVGQGVDPSVAQMTIVTVGDDQVVEQITKQLNKLVDTIKVVDLSESSFVSRETVMVKVNTTTRPEDRQEGFRIAEIFRAHIVDTSPSTYTLMVTGEEEKIEAMIGLLRPLGIKELVRSGTIAIAREESRPSSSSLKQDGEIPA